MAKFDIAEHKTGRNEGGYANDPADTGGETYAGISRNNWPKWEGWKIIDQIKTAYGKTAAIINRQAKANYSLNKLISEFYKQNFWDVNKLDQFEDQQIANSVYDFGVNSGTSRAAKYLQDVLGVKQDGKIGNITLKALNEGSSKAIYLAYKCKREDFYHSIAKGTQAKFLPSWLSRLEDYDEAIT